MFVIRVRECSTRHHVLREVLGYHASTVRKLLMDAGHTQTHTEYMFKNIAIKKNSQCAEERNRLFFYSSVRSVEKRGFGAVLTLVEWDGGHSAGIE